LNSVGFAVRAADVPEVDVAVGLDGRQDGEEVGLEVGESRPLGHETISSKGTIPMPKTVLQRLKTTSATHRKGNVLAARASSTSSYVARFVPRIQMPVGLQAAIVGSWKRRRAAEAVFP
jgi:hypothetical protein